MKACFPISYIIFPISYFVSKFYFCSYIKLLFNGFDQSGTGGVLNFDKTPSVMTRLATILTTENRENDVHLIAGVGGPYSVGGKVIGGK